MNYEAIFRARGEAYAAAMHRWPEARRDEFLFPVRLAGVVAGETVLDVPAGGGYLQRYLPAGSHWRGHEPCASFFADRVELNAGLLPLPFADGSADVAISVAGVHHLADKRPLLCELHRALRPGGRLVVADAHAGSAVARFLDEFVGRYNSTGHEGIYLDERTVADVASAGLVLERVEQLRYAWWFANRDDMAAFCRQLFDMREATLPMVLEAIESRLGIVTREGDAGPEFGMSWELRALLCRKAGL